MKANPFKGGRNHKAPYSTTHLRVPTPLKSVIERVVEIYKLFCSTEEPLDGIQFIDELVHMLKGYRFWCGVLINDNKLVTFREYEALAEKLESATYEINRLRLSVHQHEKARIEIKVFLEDACKLRANAGGAIKKEIKKVIDIL